MIRALEQKDKELAEAKSLITKKDSLAEEKQREISRLQENHARKQAMDELLAPLGKDKKEVMSSLLESVQTSKLRQAFDKYLPTVMDGETRKAKKQALTESTEVTGNRETKPEVGLLDNIVDIRKLAGLTK